MFALAKQIQWTHGDQCSEGKIVVIIEGLYIEMDALKVVGKWLTGSGGAEMICNSGVALQGVADSFLTAKHVTRTRRAHQVTAACLYILMRKSYEVLQSNVTADEESKTFQDWKRDRESKSSQFLYWSRVLDLELICLKLVRCVVFFVHAFILSL